jgi:phosphatidylglycerol---prolipoprotein diacylglyceryl transferase
MIPWNVDPELLTLGPFHFRWYGILFALGFILSYYVLGWIFQKENRSEEDLNKLLLYSMVAVVLGARLGHCIFYDPGYYFSNPVQILKVWEGGLASHGAAIGIIIAFMLYVKRTPGISFYWLADRAAVVIPIAAMCVRIGNFFNSEIVGLPSNVAWSVVFERVDQIPRHPVVLYEAIAYLVLFLILFTLYKKGDVLRRPRLNTGIFLLGLFSARFVLEFFKTGQSALDPSMPITMGQLLSIPLASFGLYLIVKARKDPPVEPQARKDKKNPPSAG